MPSTLFQASARAFTFSFSFSLSAFTRKSVNNNFKQGLYLVLLRAFVKKFLIHLHEELECIVDQPMNGLQEENSELSIQSTEARINQHYLVPMIFAVPVKSREHDRKDGGGVVADEAHNVPWRKICDLSNLFQEFLSTYSLFQ